MTQMIPLTSRFNARQLDQRTDRGNRFDAHPGEWAVSDDQANYVGIFPTVEDARTWAEAQLTRVEQVAAELFRQSYPAALEGIGWRDLPKDVREGYESRAELLVNAYRWVPMTAEYAEETN